MQKLIYPLLLLASLASQLVIPQSANAQNTDLFRKDNLNTLSPPNPHKPMGLCAGILMDVLEDPRYESLVNDLLKAVNDYGIGELMVMGRPQTLIAVPDFPKLEQTVDQARLDRLRKQLLRFKAKGLKISFMGGEPRLPRNFFEVYPEAQFVYNGLLWKYLESRTTEIFEHIPEVDTFEAYLWETELLNDRDFFRELRWSGPDPAPILGPTQYYSPADYLTQTIAALSRGARAAGKEFRLLTFAHYRWQENLLIEALRQFDHDLPLTLNHKGQPGDWDPFRPANNVMLTITDREAMLQFDGVGEYWGQSTVPYAYPEEIQQRLQHALRHNPSIRSLGMRVVWAEGRNLFGAFNEINFFALSKLAKDPYMPVETIWKEWAEKRFGREAAPKVTEALKRTNEIGNLTFYFKGMWVQRHSGISDLPYLEAQVLHTGRSMVEWSQDNIEANILLNEFMYHPGERVIDVAIRDRQEALRLNQLSLDDVESVRSVLPPAEYEKLSKQLSLQRDFITTSIPHIEAFLRYWIQRHSPSGENLKKLEAPLVELERQAVIVEKRYQEKEPFLSAKLIRTYVQQVRDAVTQLSGKPGSE